MKIHILVVDDEKEVSFIFKHQFKKWVKNDKAILSFSFSGQEALDTLKSQNGADIILILSDINMPGMDGYGVLEAVSKEFPDIKTIMVSGYSKETHKGKAIDLGAVDYFEKPVDFPTLKNKIIEMFPELKLGA